MTLIQKQPCTFIGPAERPFTFVDSDIEADRTRNFKKFTTVLSEIRARRNGAAADALKKVEADRQAITDKRVSEIVVRNNRIAKENEAIRQPERRMSDPVLKKPVSLARSASSP